MKILDIDKLSRMELWEVAEAVGPTTAREVLERLAEKQAVDGR